MLLQMINYETKRGRSYEILTIFSDMGYLLVIHIVFIHDQSKFNSEILRLQFGHCLLPQISYCIVTSVAQPQCVTSRTTVTANGGV